MHGSSETGGEVEMWGFWEQEQSSGASTRQRWKEKTGCQGKGQAAGSTEYAHSRARLLWAGRTQIQSWTILTCSHVA